MSGPYASRASNQPINEHDGLGSNSVHYVVVCPLGVAHLTLAQKTALIVALFAMANVGIAYSIHRNVVAPEFAVLEQQEVEKNMKRALLAIQREAFVLDVLAQDTASVFLRDESQPGCAEDHRNRLGGRR